METFTEFLNGKKTYLVALGVGITAVLEYYGVFDAEVAGVVFSLLGASALATGRHALSKLN